MPRRITQQLPPWDLAVAASLRQYRHGKGPTPYAREHTYLAGPSERDPARAAEQEISAARERTGVNGRERSASGCVSSAIITTAAARNCLSHVSPRASD